MIGPLPRVNYAWQKKMKTPTDSALNCTSLLKSLVVSVPSTGVTNRQQFNKKVKKKKAQKFLNYTFIYKL